MESSPNRFSWLEIAELAYRAYAASTGNKNFRGDPMPAFADLPRPIRTAWEAAARHTHRVLICGMTAELEPDQIDRLTDPGRWAGWSPLD